MDRFEKATLNALIAGIEDALDAAHDDLMDLEYADEDCTFYYEDQVWEIKTKCFGKIRAILNMMRKELQDESGKM